MAACAPAWMSAGDVDQLMNQLTGHVSYHQAAFLCASIEATTGRVLSRAGSNFSVAFASPRAAETTGLRMLSTDFWGAGSVPVAASATPRGGATFGASGRQHSP